MYVCVSAFSIIYTVHFTLEYTHTLLYKHVLLKSINKVCLFNFFNVIFLIVKNDVDIKILDKLIQNSYFVLLFLFSPVSDIIKAAPPSPMLFMNSNVLWVIASSISIIK